MIASCIYNALRQRLCIAASLATLAAAHAQPAYYVENLTTADGLSDDRLTCVMKDHVGFVWIGTEGGLNRYDGHAFKIYTTTSDARISSPYVNDVEEDQDGNIWVASQGGLDVINPVTDSVYSFSSDDVDKRKQLPSDLIWDVLIDKDKVWVAADARDLFVLNSATRTFRSFAWQEFARQVDPARHSPYLSIQKIYRKAPGELWLGTSAGVFSFSEQTETFSYHPSERLDYFVALQTAPDGKTVYFSQESFPFVQKLHVENNSRAVFAWNSLPSADATTRERSAEDAWVWVPAGEEIVQINTSTNEMTRISHIPDDMHSLLPEGVRSIYRDSSGLVWVATKRGLSRFDPATPAFRYTEIIPSTPSAPRVSDPLRTDDLLHTVFFSEADQSYYISSPATNSLIIFNEATGRKQRVTHIDGYPLTRCSVIAEDSRGQLWILATPYAFVRDRKTGRFSVSSFHSDSRNALFTDMTDDGHGTYWFAALNDGLYRYDAAKGHHQKIATAGFSTTQPTSLCFDQSSDKLWIGTFDYGLYVHDRKRNTYQWFSPSRTTKGAIPSALITDIVKDKRDRIWVSTFSGGIAYCDPANTDSDKFVLVSVDNGLAENSIFSMQVDATGNVWATGDKGLSCIRNDGQEIENFGRAQGLHRTALHHPVTITREGVLITGAGSGFVRFDPAKAQYSHSFPVVITEARADSVVLRAGTTTRLSYKSNRVEIDFAALNFREPERNVFECRLAGLSKQWVPQGNVSQIIYNNLTAGRYTFEVRARDARGNYSSNVASLDFEIAPPWWNTWWFKTAAIGLIAVSVVTLFQRRVNSVRKDAAIKQQLIELKGQAVRSQMNPHFIFNCLNSIQELIVGEKYDAAYEYLAKFSKLLRIVLEVSEKNLIPVREEVELCRLYVQLESLRFGHSFHYNIDASGVDEDMVLFPTLLVQPFIENAIWHGLMEKQGEKQLEVRFTENEYAVQCTIRDNGIGFRRATEISAAKAGSIHFSSKGISLATQRVDALRAAGNDATIEIKDLADEQGVASGTEVIITCSFETS